MKKQTVFTMVTMLVIAGLWSCTDSDNDNDNDSDNVDNDEFSDVRQQCVDRINEFRATEGVAPLTRWKDAEVCSDDEAQQDSESGVAHGAFGQCDEFAQNECPGWPSIDDILEGCLQAMWDEGPGEPFEEHGHYINMSNEAYTKVACGFYTTPQGEIWSVQNFK